MELEKIREVVEPYVEKFEVISERRVNAHVDKQRYREALRALKARDIMHLSTITGVDRGKTIEVIYHFDCGGVVLNLRLSLPKTAPNLRTITDLFPGALLYERELAEMLGVKIEGHPDPRRLFLPEDWPADDHPLRKEASS